MDEFNNPEYKKVFVKFRIDGVFTQIFGLKPASYMSSPQNSSTLIDSLKNGFKKKYDQLREKISFYIRKNRLPNN